jgi:hypothetical protein
MARALPIKAQATPGKSNTAKQALRRELFLSEEKLL